MRYGAALVTVPLECGGGGDPLVSPLRGLISQAENLFRKDTLMRDSGSELPAGNGNGFPPAPYVSQARALDPRVHSIAWYQQPDASAGSFLCGRTESLAPAAGFHMK